MSALLRENPVSPASCEAINADANASFGLLPEVIEFLRAELPYFLNPSSIHQGGQTAKSLVENARAEIAEFLGLARGDRLVFTSGATESNNTALAFGLNLVDRRPHIVTSAVEHPSVREVALSAQRGGKTVTFVPVDRDSGINLSAFEAALSPDVTIVSVMTANNETGHLFPIASLSKLVRTNSPRALFHTDAVQALGKAPLCFRDLGVDLMSLSGHKIGALSGVGALVVAEHVPFQSQLLGGPQEGRLRAGTENVVGIATFGVAVAALRKSMARRIAAMQQGREVISKELAAAFPDAQFNSLEGGLPNTLNVRFPRVRADDLVVALDSMGVRVSSGAACASGKPEPSHVLLALGLSAEAAKESIRISLNGDDGPQSAQRIAAAIITCVRRMRGEGK